MKIRSKIILVVLPVAILSLGLAQTASYFSARSGITRIAQSFLNFKASGLENYAESQWNLLVENNFAGRPDMVQAAQNAVLMYATSILLSDTEVILALDDDGNTVMATGDLGISDAERERLLEILAGDSQGIFHAAIGGEARVFTAFYFSPFRWHVLLTEEASAFYRDADRIRVQTIAVLGITIFIAVLMLIFFARHLTNPLARVVNAMNAITSGGDLSSRVEVEYRDETGKLASTFNIMIAELEKAYAEIKRYAFDAVLAGKKRTAYQADIPKVRSQRFNR